MTENNKTVRSEGTPEMPTGGRTPNGKRPSTGRRVTRKMALNAFDIIVILLVIAVVALAIVALSMGSLFTDEDGKDAQLSYTVRISGIDEAFAGAIRAGHTVYDADTGEVIGQVVNAPTVVRHQEPTTLEENGVYSAQMKDVPGTVDITLTLTVVATHEAGLGYRVGTTAIRVGQSYVVRTPDYLGRAVCISIDRVTELAH